MTTEGIQGLHRLRNLTIEKIMITEGSSSSFEESRNAVTTFTISCIVPWRAKALFHSRLHLFNKVLVCTAHLKGRCKMTQQRISSDLTQQRMPVIRGGCKWSYCWSLSACVPYYCL
ncbi:hypothetical protein F0562_031768 [Nyssa sinensis]|uniref:Uncharacterized protein n=1 Tax=Nyssa sinensis TaxID=561372 RepID=A0A5J5AZ48_9ASTE|nr:hypothetical protein F0562_031768 [Nyssa sinensis]